MSNNMLRNKHILFDLSVRECQAIPLNAKGSTTDKTPNRPHIGLTDAMYQADRIWYLAHLVIVAGNCVF